MLRLATSIYFFWSYHSSQKDVFDMTTGARNVQRLIDYAKQAGLYVIARPGPYCNAETNAGGFALWTTKGSLGRWRQTNLEYFATWRPWVREIALILKKNQITQGGPVILNQLENELKQTGYSPSDSRTQYMEELKKAFREEGLVVPFTHNEAGMRGSPSFSTDYMNPSGTGTVNIYGLDSYPGGLGCANKDQGFKLVRTYDQWFSNSSLTQPRYMPEFEAGTSVRMEHDQMLTSCRLVYAMGRSIL
jgi:beta-galactosidase GanA